jgi:hypothetical protein
MEKYGDLITNGLDLTSFLLVTPELVRVVAPTATRLTNLAIAVIASFLVAALLLIPVSLIAIWFQFEGPWWIIVLILYLISQGFLSRMSNDLTDRFSRWVSEHFLALGVALFFVSRLIAFYGSALKVGLL